MQQIPLGIKANALNVNVKTIYKNIINKNFEIIIAKEKHVFLDII